MKVLHVKPRYVTVNEKKIHTAISGASCKKQIEIARDARTFVAFKVGRRVTPISIGLGCVSLRVFVHENLAHSRVPANYRPVNYTRRSRG